MKVEDSISSEEPKCSWNEQSPDSLCDRFSNDGYLHLTGAIPRESLEEWIVYADDYFQKMFQTLHENGHAEFPTHSITNDKGEQIYGMRLGVKHGFREIVMRSPGRYELSLLNCPQYPPLDNIRQCLPSVPALLQASGWDEVKLVHVSLLVSTPGSAAQTWHTDGSHMSVTEYLPCHCFNVFIPLCDVLRERGPTEFRPETHSFFKLAPMILAAKARKTLRARHAPELQLGDVLIFDYRVLHRGLANKSTTNRNILVLTFSQPWYNDLSNFPTRSMFDST